MKKIFLILLLIGNTRTFTMDVLRTIFPVDSSDDSADDSSYDERQRLSKLCCEYARSNGTDVGRLGEINKLLQSPYIRNTSRDTRRLDSNDQILEYVMMNAKEDLIDLLLANGFKLIFDGQRHSVLCSAAGKTDLKKFMEKYEKVLRSDPFPVNFRRHIESPLFAAAKAGNVDNMRLLLRMGALVDNGCPNSVLGMLEDRIKKSKEGSSERLRLAMSTNLLVKKEKKD